MMTVITVMTVVNVKEGVLQSERQKRFVDEQRDTEARRHSDYLKYMLVLIHSFTSTHSAWLSLLGW